MSASDVLLAYFFKRSLNVEVALSNVEYVFSNWFFFTNVRPFLAAILISKVG